MRKIFDASDVVIGPIGGVDSNLTVMPCVHALDRDKVSAVLLPTDFVPRKDVEDTLQLAKMLEIPTEIVNVQGILESSGCSTKRYGDCGKQERYT